MIYPQLFPGFCVPNSVSHCVLSLYLLDLLFTSFQPRTLFLDQATAIPIPNYPSHLSGLPNTTEQPDGGFQRISLLVSPFCSKQSRGLAPPTAQVQALDSSSCQRPWEIHPSSALSPMLLFQNSGVQVSKITC